MRCLSALSTNHVRKLILGDVRLHWRHFGHLMPARLSFRSRLGGLLRQAFSAVPALLGQQYLSGAHLGGGNQSSMMSRVPRLGARFPLALVLAAARSLFTSHVVFGIHDLLFAFG